MLIIRKEQREAFRQQRHQRFRVKMLEHLRSSFPDQWADKGEEEILRFVDQGLEKSQLYGLRTEYAIQRVLELICDFSHDFDTSEQIQNILNAPNLKERLKMDLAAECLNESRK
jgi:hypothetical protein